MALDFGFARKGKGTLVPFSDRLADAILQRKNPVVVGLDPRLGQLPEAIFPGEDADFPTQSKAYALFCKEIIDVVSGRVPAVKPQMAFFEALGPCGLQALAEVIAYARQRDLLVILDGKRNDIGSTATAYAEAYLGADSPWGADALTVSPYLGDDSLTPFVEAGLSKDAGIFVLVKTSNPGGKTFQDQLIDGQPLYRHVAQLVETLATETQGTHGYGAVGAVVGATYPEQLVELRAAMPHSWFLVPGFGAQGGTAESVRHAMDERGLGAIINSSRGIIFAHARPEYESLASSSWLAAVEQATRDMIDQLAVPVR